MKQGTYRPHMGGKSTKVTNGSSTKRMAPSPKTEPASQPYVSSDDSYTRRDDGPGLGTVLAVGLILGGLLG
jgi:hypothetical protein